MFPNPYSQSFKELFAKFVWESNYLVKIIIWKIVINILFFRPVEHDQFRLRVTVDVVDSRGSLQSEVVKKTIFEPIQTSHRIGAFTAIPDQFYFREFGGNETKEWTYCITFGKCSNVYTCRHILYTLLIKKKDFFKEI